MAPALSLGGSRRRFLVAFALLLFVAGMVVPVLGAVPVSTRAPGHVAVLGSPAASVALKPHSAPALSLPLTLPNSVNGTFYRNTTGFAVPPAGTTFCYRPYYYYSPTCYPQAQQPDLLPLANGHIGASYSLLTNSSASTCNGANVTVNATGNTTVRVGFSLSSNGGQSFGKPHLLGNNSCPYIQALEPSFAVSSTGDVFGTFVEANASATAMMGIYGYGAPVIEYGPRSSDALAFVRSTDNGTTFPNATTIPQSGFANIARPSLAAYGRTIYIAYDNISNGTTPLPGSSSSPIAVQFVYSNDAGATWHGPFTLPGLNSSQSYSSMSPAVTVAPNGTVVVAYATNRACLAYCGVAYLEAYGDDIVVARSTANGTVWAGPFVVAHNFGGGESIQFSANYVYCTVCLFEYSPEIRALFGPTGTLYVAWSGAVNQSNVYSYAQYLSTQAFSAVSTNDAVSWTNSTVGAPLANSPNTYIVSYFNPGIGLSPTGALYYALTLYNTSGFSSCGSPTNAYSSGYFEFITTSPDGLHWGSLVASGASQYGSGYDTYFGYHSSVAFTAAGAPLAAYTLPQPYVYANSSSNEPASLFVASPFTGSTTTLTIRESNVPTGASWGVSVDGNVVTTTAPNVTVANVPDGSAVVVVPWGNAVNDGYWAELVPSISSSVFVIHGPTTITDNFTQYYGIRFSPEPQNIYSYVNIYNYGLVHPYDFYYYWGNTYPPAQGGCPFPWYLPAGFSFTLSNLGSYPVGSYYGTGLPANYWNGTGTGSYTGLGNSAPLTVSGPFNETWWMQTIGKYNVTVQAPGLPVNTSYSFLWDGTLYNGLGGTPVSVPSVLAGPHWITEVQATAAQSGWMYFGTATVGNPVPIPEQPVVNLSFAYVHVSAPFGVVSFHAVGLVPGSVWDLRINGTEYSSPTPWINFTAHPGNYSESLYPVVAADGQTAYTPTSNPGYANVTTGSTYPVSFTYAYHLGVTAAFGGTVSPSGGSTFYAPGSRESFTAMAKPGFKFGGWTGSGPGSYTGTSPFANVTVNGPIQENAAFYPLSPYRFNLTFTQNTLPNGTSWTVYINGAGYGSNGSVLNIPNVLSCAWSGSAGRYSLLVPYVYYNGTNFTRYVPVHPPTAVCGGGSQPLVFAPQFHVAISSTTGGSVSWITGTGNPETATSFWTASGASVSLTATPNPGEIFLGWNGTGPGSYTGTLNPATIVVAAPVLEVAAFGVPYVAPAPRYWVDFHLASPLSNGTVWTITLNGTSYSSYGVDLVVHGLVRGSYPLAVRSTASPDGLTQFTPASSPGPVSVTSNKTVPLAFRTAFWVSISHTGTGNTSPSSGWFPSGTNLAISASPSYGKLFAGWKGSGPSAYSGPDANASITLVGPISEVAAFILPAPAVIVITSSWNSSSLWATLALIGLVVGLVVGVAAMRLRKSPPSSPSVSPEGAGPAPSEGNEARPTADPSAEAGGGA